MSVKSYTHSCLSCFRRCPREFDLRYQMQLERVGDDRETLAVGTCWHKAHDAASKSGADAAAYAVITAQAPGELWAEKLRRLFAAYRWRWSNHELKMLKSEQQFEYVDAEGRTRRGQIDGLIEVSGQVGNLERKTSGEDIDDGSSFWQRQRMGPQVSFYGNAFKALTGTPPAFTLYDVVRKPTIRPKTLVKADMTRLRAELTKDGTATYFGEKFGAEEIEIALGEGRETSALYGARLTADIGDRPDFYFARKVIPRTTLDLQLAERDTVQTIDAIESLSRRQEIEASIAIPQLPIFPRNPDSCDVFGVCDFFALCSNGEYPQPNTIPSGFARRGVLHPELDEAQQ